MLGIVGLAGSGGLDVLGGYAAPDFAGADLGVLEHQCAGGDDGAFADFAAVEQGGAHADEGVVVDGAGVDGDVMADGDVAADVGGAGLVGDVDAGAVLHVGAVADGDGCDVAAHDGVEPDGAVVAHRDVADDGCVLAEVAVFAPFGRKSFITFD